MYILYIIMTDINGNSSTLGANVVVNPLDKDLNIGSYDIVGLFAGQTLNGINATQILQTDIINDSANKLINCTSAILGTTTYDGLLRVPIVAVDTLSDTLQSSSLSMSVGGINITSDSLSFNNKPIISTPYANQIECTSLKITGADSGVYVMADGSTLKYSSNSGNSNYYLYNSSTTQNVTPSIGDITYNNAVQANATMIYISHRTRDTIDIEIFFKQLSSLIEVYIQDQETSLNYIQYNIIGTPTITPEAQVAIPVVMRLGAGTGLTNFSNGHNVLLSFFTNSIETDSRLSTLESKTINQTAINGVSTNFSGSVISTKFEKTTGGSASHFWKTDGSVDITQYASTSALNSTNVDVATLLNRTQNQSATVDTTTISDKLILNSVQLNGISNTNFMTLDKPYFGIKYVHTTSTPVATAYTSPYTAYGSTSLSAAPYNAGGTMFTKQNGCALWTTVALADGAVCGLGSSATTGVQINRKFPFGIFFSGGIADSAYNANNCQNFWGGYAATTAIPLNQTTQLSVQRSLIGFGSNTTDVNICIYTAGLNTNAVKQVDLGVSFPSNRPAGVISSNWYKLALWWDGATTVYYNCVNATLDVTVQGSFIPLATDMPLGNYGLNPQCVRVMGTPQSNGQGRLQVQQFGIF